MQLVHLSASRYRCLRDVSFGLGDLNVFIGPNASGKSTVLDALRFLQEGVQQRDFQQAVLSRLGILALAWMGDEQRPISLKLELAEQQRRFHWQVVLNRRGNGFVEMAHKLVSAAWFKAAVPPDKFVVLLDADGREPDRILQPFRHLLPQLLHGSITAALQFAVAQCHLEAWYFADVASLKGYLGRSPGVDVAKRDEISNPKLHLKHLLGNRVYSAAVAEEIARVLDAAVIAGRSPSFHGFIAALRNGGTPPAASAPNAVK